MLLATVRMRQERPYHGSLIATQKWKEFPSI